MSADRRWPCLVLELLCFRCYFVVSVVRVDVGVGALVASIVAFLFLLVVVFLVAFLFVVVLLLLVLFVGVCVLPLVGLVGFGEVVMGVMVVCCWLQGASMV